MPEYQLKLEDAYAARTAGQNSVESNEREDWKAAAMDVVYALASQNLYLFGDDVRRACYAIGLPDPHHHNVWSVLLPMAAKRGWIERVNYTTSAARQGHGNRVVLWRSLLTYTQTERPANG